MRQWFLFGLLALCGLGCGVSSSSSSSSSSTVSATASLLATLSTTGRCYLGAFVDDLTQSGDTSGITSTADMAAYETLVGKGIALSMIYQSFSSGGTLYPYPTANMDAVRSYGATPVLTLEPWDLATTTDSLLTGITTGSYDAFLSAMVRGISAYGDPVLVRFAHEMNGNWYPWSGSSNESRGTRYIETYRYVHTYFANAGVTNVLWVWCPNANSVPSENWNEASDYYPGDSYVDVIGVDGYNFGGSSETSFSTRFGSFYATYQSEWSDKPLIIAEMGAADTATSKSGWITDAYNQIQNTYTAVRAVMWFHNNGGTGEDFRIDSGTGVQSAFQTAVAGTYFKGVF